MKMLLAMITIVFASTPLFCGDPVDPTIILRGDANSDGQIDGSDVITITGWYYQGGDEPPCMNQADVNNDGEVDGSDAIYLANWLYSGGYAPPDPGAPPNDKCVKEDYPYPGCENIICPSW